MTPESIELLSCLRACLVEIDSEIEQRKCSGNDEYWAGLQTLYKRSIAAIASLEAMQTPHDDLIAQAAKLADDMELHATEEWDESELLHSMIAALVKAEAARVKATQQFSNAQRMLDAAEARAQKAQEERDEWARVAGGGCDASDGGYHTVMRQDRYSFCAKCGESLKGVRFCHGPRTTLAGKEGR